VTESDPTKISVYMYLMLLSLQLHSRITKLSYHMLNNANELFDENLSPM